MSAVSYKCTLVPREFFDREKVREALGSVVILDDSDQVKYAEVPQYDAVLLYATNHISGSRSKDGSPEMLRILGDLSNLKCHNKIVALWKDFHLFLAIAQGDDLSYANVFKAASGETVLYYISLVMKSLQLNPAVSTIFLKDCQDEEFVKSLYRYFDAVGRI